MKKIVISGKSDIVKLIILCTLIILSITAIVLHFALFKISFISFINSFFILVATGIICFFVGLSLGGSSGKSKNSQSDVNEYNQNGVLTAKKFFGGLGIFLLCGFGYVPLILIASNNIKKVNSSEYVKTQATIVGIAGTASSSGNPIVSLRYQYYDENGNKFISLSNASWGGITFKEGETTVIYYSKSNPEITLNISDSVMMLSGAALFFGGGILLFLGITERNRLFPIVFGLMFMLFCGGVLTGMKIASGLNFFLLFCSGASAYLMLMFCGLGLVLFIYGIISAINSIKYNLKNKSAGGKKNKDLNNLLDSKQYEPQDFVDKSDKESIKLNKEDFKLNNKTKGLLSKEYETISGYNKEIDNDLDNSLKKRNKIISEMLCKKTINEKVCEETKTQNTNKKRYKSKSFWNIFKGYFGIIFAGLIFFVTGTCVMIMLGIIPLAKTASFVKTEATVTKISTYYNKEGSLMATFEYEYYVNGVKFEKESSYAQSAEIAPIKGDKITIYYDKNNPDIINDSNWTDWLILVVGFIFMAVGIGLIGVPIYTSIKDAHSYKVLSKRKKNA